MHPLASGTGIFSGAITLARDVTFTAEKADVPAAVCGAAALSARAPYHVGARAMSGFGRAASPRPPRVVLAASG